MEQMIGVCTAEEAITSLADPRVTTCLLLLEMSGNFRKKNQLNAGGKS